MIRFDRTRMATKAHKMIWKAAVLDQKCVFWGLWHIFSKNSKKDEKRCWQMVDGVIVYASPRERGEQNNLKTDEVWIELRRKPKNSAQNGAWKFFEKIRKKFLTNGSEYGRMHQVGSEFGKRFQKSLKKLEKSSWQTRNDMIYWISCLREQKSLKSCTL